MKDLSRKITMHCPICGNDQFSTLDSEFEDLADAPDDARLQCSDCKTVFSKEELIEENQASVKNCSQKVSIESPMMIRRPVVQGFL